MIVYDETNADLVLEDDQGDFSYVFMVWLLGAGEVRCLSIQKDYDYPKLFVCSEYDAHQAVRPLYNDNWTINTLTEKWEEMTKRIVEPHVIGRWGKSLEIRAGLEFIELAQVTGDDEEDVATVRLEYKERDKRGLYLLLRDESIVDSGGKAEKISFSECW